MEDFSSDGLAAADVLLGDLARGLLVYRAVPDAFGVDDDDGAVVALIEAIDGREHRAAVVRQLLKGAFEFAADLAPALLETVLVGADEQVVRDFFEFRQISVAAARKTRALDGLRRVADRQIEGSGGDFAEAAVAVEGDGD